MAGEICSVEGCDRAKHARGWCLRHYMRWYQSGTLELHPRFGQEPAPVDDEAFVQAVVAVCGVKYEMATRLAKFFAARTEGIDKYSAIHQVGVGSGDRGTANRYEHWWAYYQQHSTTGAAS